MNRLRATALVLVMLGAILSVACGGANTASHSESAATDALVVETVVVEKEAAREFAKAAPPTAMPTPPPAPFESGGVAGAAYGDAARSAAGFPGPAGPGAIVEATAGESGLSISLARQAALTAASKRIVVRTVDMELTVDDVSRSLDAISGIAVQSGGWVVSTEHTQLQRGSIAIRVPAERLEEALVEIRAQGIAVDSEVSSSQDVTDEYTDLEAGLKNLKATEAVLLSLYDRAETVEDAIKVQAEVTKVQGEIERLEGRRKFLAQTSAFSLVNVALKTLPVEMVTDAGPDVTTAVGRSVRFRASFALPEEISGKIEDYTIVWDFGDGTPPVTVNRTAPSVDEKTRFTAPVSHRYPTDEDSPYIVTVEITGSGPGGIVEGSDTLIATVSEVPVIEVFAGEDTKVEAGEEVELTGSFTRPLGLERVRWEWDFGDGSKPVAGEAGPGVTTAAATHAYANHRPAPFNATLRVTGDSEAGEAEASDSVWVTVTESRGLVVSGWDVGATGRDAVRALSVVAAGALRAAIWLGVFSPVWIAGIALLAWLRRRSKSRFRKPGGRAGGGGPSAGEPGEADLPGGTAG